jgi:hypothetical protein
MAISRAGQVDISVNSKEFSHLSAQASQNRCQIVNQSPEDRIKYIIDSSGYFKIFDEYVCMFELNNRLDMEFESFEDLVLTERFLKAEFSIKASNLG